MKRAFVGVATALLALGASAHSQQPSTPHYRLYAGAGEEPCESLLAHVRSATAAPLLYNWCDVPIDRTDSRFTQPDWRTLNWRENLDVVQEIFVRGEDMAAWSSMYQSKHPLSGEAYDVATIEYWPALRTKVLKGFETGQAQLQVAEFDFDNDGQNERVVRMTSWNVVPAPRDDGTMPASEREVQFATPCYPGTSRYRYMRLMEMPAIYHTSGLSRYLDFDGYLFQFNGKTYFGISPNSVSLTFRGVGKGPAMFLWGDHREGKNRCGIIAD